MKTIDSLLQLIAPHECLGCMAEGRILCDRCITSLPLLEAPVSTPGGTVVRAATTYEGIAKQAVYALKFERTAAVVEDIGRCIVNILPVGAYEVVTYVPTATSRVRQRGYDQAGLIARAVAIHLRVPCVSLLARRGKQRQVGTGREMRLQQMRMAFRPVRHYAGQDKRVLLIDDVITTGSTIEAAARQLQAAGVRTVDAAVFAAARL